MTQKNNLFEWLDYTQLLSYVDLTVTSWVLFCLDICLDIIHRRCNLNRLVLKYWWLKLIIAWNNEFFLVKNLGPKYFKWNRYIWWHSVFEAKLSLISSNAAVILELNLKLYLWFKWKEIHIIFIETRLGQRSVQKIKIISCFCVSRNLYHLFFIEPR
jgi:hypothetical protein